MSRMAMPSQVSGYPAGAMPVSRPLQVSQAKTVSPMTSAVSPTSAIRTAAPVIKAGTAGISPLAATTRLAPGVAPGSPLAPGSVRQARVISAGQSIGGQAAVPLSSPAPASTAPRVIQPTAVRPATTIASATAPRPTVTGGMASTQAAYEVKHKDDRQLQNLKELRRTSGLKSIPVGSALQCLKETSLDGKLTRDQFLNAYMLLLQKHSVEIPSEDVKNAVFDLFDRDDNGVVDMMEVICGASLLCAGAEDDKIHAVFEVFDENGDGVISMDEMFKFLTSVFKVVLTPNVIAVMNSMGVTVESAEDLASVTALECFKTADLDQDGKLSVAEFKNWFYAPRNDPSFLFSPVRKLLQ